MSQNDPHVLDCEFLLMADGELSSRRAREIRRHLQHCTECRVRRHRIEQTFAMFVEGRRQALDHELPPIEGARALLRANMAEAAASCETHPWKRFRQLLFRQHRLLYVAGAFLIFAAAFLFQTGRTHQRKGPLKPNPVLTPGATVSATRERLCAADDVDKDHRVPVALAHMVFEHYGIQNPKPRTYEVDYLITPALGGADDIRNLWPQSYSSGLWNAQIKDALEQHLRQLVCDGTLDLADAQREIAGDWIAAYKKYFHTREPLVAHFTFRKDRPWGE